MTEGEGYRRRRLGLAEASLGLVACAAVMGWAASFVGLHDFGAHNMRGYSDLTAWFVPATFDGAAFGTTLITYRASINGRGAFRARILMWLFTAVSSWINWVHQPSGRAQFVAAGLPIAAVAVFDVVMLEMRGDYEARHGRRAFRLRPGLLVLRWIVDRTGTSDAFRAQIRSISVTALAGLGSDLDNERQPPAITAADTSDPAELHQPSVDRPAGDSVDDSAANKAGDAVGEGVDVQAQHAAEDAEDAAVEAAENTAETTAVDAAVDAAVDTAENAAAENTAVDEPVIQVDPVDRLGAPERVRSRAMDETVELPALSSNAVREAARDEVRHALRSGGEPPTRQELAQRYGRSERWAQQQLRIVREEQDAETEHEADRRLVAVGGR